MVIVDTSIWVDSMRSRDDRLGDWMAADLILQHPFVTAEISMGSFPSTAVRTRTIDLLGSFEQIEIAGPQVFHSFVAEHSLYGTGIGFADAHLLHTCFANPNARLATRDKRLAEQAERLGLPCDHPA
jgi:predicted nucleic acid-binding protein